MKTIWKFIARNLIFNKLTCSAWCISDIEYQVLSGYCMIVPPFMYPTPENDPLRNPTTTVLLVCVRLIIMICEIKDFRILFVSFPAAACTHQHKQNSLYCQRGCRPELLEYPDSSLSYPLPLQNHHLATSTVKTGSAYYTIWHLTVTIMKILS